MTYVCTISHTVRRADSDGWHEYVAGHQYDFDGDPPTPYFTVVRHDDQPEGGS